MKRLSSHPLGARNEATPIPLRSVAGAAAHAHTLSRRQLCAFWHRLARSPLPAPIKILLRLIILTGRSKDEWARASWASIDLERGRWRQQDMPLSAPVLNELASLRKLTGPDATMLFPGLNLGRVTLSSSIDITLRKYAAWFPLSRGLRTEMLRQTALEFIAQQRCEPHAADGRCPESILRWGEVCNRWVSGQPANVLHLNPGHSHR